MEADALTDVSNTVLRARALVFDFDGTLVDSNAIKWRAFEKCFTEFPDRHEEIFKYCQGNNHITRGDKFRHVYETILKIPYTPTIEADLHERFAAATESQIIAAPEIPGTARFLAGVMRSHITALLSSTPHDTLLYILSERGWKDYFEVIKGGPVDKAGWLTTFQDQYKIGKHEMVVFGDTIEDARSAGSAGSAFIAVGEGGIGIGAHQWIPDFIKLSPLSYAELIS